MLNIVRNYRIGWLYYALENQNFWCRRSKNNPVVLILKWKYLYKSWTTSSSCPLKRLETMTNSIILCISSNHLPLIVGRDFWKMADSRSWGGGEGGVVINLFSYHRVRTLSKTTRVKKEGLWNQLEEIPTGQRWDNLTIKMNNCN